MYGDNTTFAAFNNLVHQLLDADLEPKEFLGVATPHLLQVGGKIFVQDGAVYGSDGRRWIKTSTVPSMDSLQTKPDYVPHPKNPDMQVKSLKVFPSAQGLPKSIDALVHGFGVIGSVFPNVSIVENSSPEEFLAQPLILPQATALFGGLKGSRYVLTVGGSVCQNADHLNPVPSDTLFAPIVELGVMAGYGDSYCADVPGPVLGSVSQYIGPRGKIVTKLAKRDFKFCVGLYDLVEKLPMVPHVIETGEVSSLERARYC